MKLPKELQDEEKNKKKVERNFLLEMTKNINFFELFEDKKISSKVPTYKVMIYNTLIMFVVEKKLSYGGINTRGDLIFTYPNVKIDDTVIVRKVSNLEIALLDLWILSLIFEKGLIPFSAWEEIISHCVKHILTKNDWFDFDMLEKMILSKGNENFLEPIDLKIYDFKGIKKNKKLKKEKK